MIEIKNRKSNDYKIVEKFVAGIILIGSEIKEVIKHDCDLTGSYCLIKDQVLLIGSYINCRNLGTWFSYDTRRDRVLLLTKPEIRKIKNELKRGYSLFPLRMFSNERGLIKVELGLGKSFKKWDKRDKIKEKISEKEKNLV